MTLDDLTPCDVERAELACSDLPLTFAIPDDLPGLLAGREPELAVRLLDLGDDDLAVLLDYLQHCQETAGALAAA